MSPASRSDGRPAGRFHGAYRPAPDAATLRRNGVRHVGFRHYIKHVFFPPGRPAWLAPFNLIEEIVRPFTLALRLFGNILAGGIMLSVIALLPFYITPALGEAAWDLFDMFIGLIQAGIFALLTILYFGFALESQEEEEAAH